MKPVVSKAPLIAVACFVLLYVVPQVTGLRINTTKSMPRGLYRVVGDGVHRGSVVSACLPEEAARLGGERHYLGPGTCAPGVEAVVKVAVALGGDLVEVDGEGVRVNGELLAASAPLTSDRGGRPLAPHIGRWRLAPGEVWLHSSYEARSWDSRYYGPVGESDLLSVVVPVLTFR